MRPVWIYYIKSGVRLRAPIANPEIWKLSDRNNWKKFIPVLIMAICAAAVVVFTVLSIAHFQEGFVYRYATVLTSTAVTVELLYVAAMIVFLLRKWNTLFKFFLSGLVLAAVLLLGFYLILATGLWDRIHSVEELRAIIRSTGAWAPVVFIVIQALQVFLLPVPGVLTVGAGVLIFGELLTCLYSYIGILLGSVIAFWIGRALGYRAAAWLVGKDSLDKWQEKVKGKDRMLLSAMFVLPLFPDDILCFVSGLSTMSWRYFIVMQLIARAISVVVTSYSLGGSIIPYNTWWGLLLWALIAAAVVVLFVFIWKKGDVLEKKFFSLFQWKKKREVAENRKPKNAQGKAKEQASVQPAETENTPPRQTKEKAEPCSEAKNIQ